MGSHEVDAAAFSLEPGTEIGPVSHRADEVMLFEFSAVGWNPHRVHYDAPYATSVEGLPGLLVTGPLQGALIESMLTAWAAPHRGRISAFEYRHRAPAYAGAHILVRGTVRQAGNEQVECEVWVECEGVRTTEGVATLTFDS